MKLNKTISTILAVATTCLVVAIAFVVPLARIHGDTASAVASVQTIVKASTQYQTQYGHCPNSFEQLSQLKGLSSDPDYAWLADPTWVKHAKNGYVFTYRALDKKHEGKPDSFTINADPIQSSPTRHWHFFSSEDGIIRMENDRPASAQSPPLGG